MRKIKGVIFDLDGTLIDSMTVWCRVDREFLAENGVTDPPADISEKIKKMTVEQAADHFITRFGLSCTQEQVIRRIEELVRVQYEERIPLKPHVMELLSLLDSRGIPYGIATATYRSLAEAVLRRCGIIGRFRFILADSDYPQGKRFPDIFLGAAERLGAEPGEILVIEDSLHCIETAVSAGFMTVGVYDELSDCDRADIERIADGYFPSLAEVITMISEALI
ncbi:MAG: HAD family phosphatase [Ruminococcus sp.]|nr:HAD family phosphatase [Ruminococcus sp.]